MFDPKPEKTEQATPKRLEEAWKKGQFARSAEVQTVFVLFGGMLALLLTGQETWRNLAGAMFGVFARLHEVELRLDGLQRFALNGALLLGACAGPVVLGTAVGGLLAGGIQARFRTASDVLAIVWERINPVSGLRRVFSPNAAVPSIIGAVKLAVVLALSWSVVESVLSDPIFSSSVGVARLARFLAESSFTIVMRVGFALVVLAGLDYSYQLWRTNRDLMMTRDELKEEQKSHEGDPKVKAAQRRRRQALSKRKMLAEVPQADVVITNPTHLAVALRYDRKSMSAPRVVAKGSRLNALRIREIARQHQVPILENKPLARLLFKYGRVGGEIPAQLYAAVAEILAHVYRVNAYRYYREQAGNA
jgi:flagellar biosynthetic protein FlhB